MCILIKQLLLMCNQNDFGFSHGRPKCTTLNFTVNGFHEWIYYGVKSDSSGASGATVLWLAFITEKTTGKMYMWEAINLFISFPT